MMLVIGICMIVGLLCFLFHMNDEEMKAEQKKSVKTVKRSMTYDINNPSNEKWIDDNRKR